MTEDTALQRGTVQVEAVDVFLSGVIVKYGQVAGDCRRTYASVIEDGEWRRGTSGTK